MPKQFVGSVEPPKDMQFGADSFVDRSSNAEAIAATGKALNQVGSTLINKSLRDQIVAADAQEQSQYAEVQKKKRQLYEAADRKDQVAVDKFTKELNDLTIAENQGAISGTNASIRKESLLRSYINRFPHREEELRQTYSTTRAALQAGRARMVNDPFEDGIDDVIKESVMKGKSPIQVLEDRQHADFMARAQLDFQYQVSLGKSVEGELEQAFDQHAMPRFYAQATDYINMAFRQAQTQGGGDVQVETIKRNLELMKSAAMSHVSETINAIAGARRTDEEGMPIMSAEFRSAQAKKVADLFDGLIKNADNVDTLKQYQRGLEYLKYDTLANLRKVDPMLRALIDMGQGEWAGKYLAEDYPRVAAVRFTQGKAGLQALMDNAATPMERNRLKLQMMMLDNVGEDAPMDLENIVKRGAPPVSTGDPYVDAVKLSAYTDSILKSQNAPTEVKDNAGAAILETEKQDSSYLGPGAHWYKNPIHRQTLRASEPLKARMREETISMLATVSRKLKEKPELAATLMFAPNLEADMLQPKAPWKAYRTGGPFTIQGDETNPANVDFEEASRMPVFGPMVPDDKVILDTLNNAYWTIRMMDGAAKAEDWAAQILAQRDADAEEKKKEDEKKSKESEAADGNFDQ
jgi:hypothetical protein